MFLVDNSSDDTCSSDSEELYDEPEQRRRAVRGERLPSEPLLAKEDIRASVVAGIRRNLDFAQSKAVKSLCKSESEDYPEFTRARNARLIMSGKIPKMDNPEHYPYCIWHPDIATEQTYAELAKTYPQMRYQVGRACAVAGYTELYKSLDLLPEVSIAEEARDNAATGGDIFKLIMASPVKYAVLDDYERTVELESPRVACLNNDTAVRSSLDVRKSSKGKAIGLWGIKYWDITEDDCQQDEDGSIEIEEPPLQPEYAHLLYSPLPPDLPPANKDVLILMAAYEGNIDRYVRLRRPQLIDGEAFCVVRGIHHSVAFARFWSRELVQGRAERCSTRDPLNSSEERNIATAINARYIMSNDVARIASAPETRLPYMIWYPHRPREVTLREVVRLQPSMKQAVAHACIVCNYRRLWDELRPQPNPVLYREAKQSPESHYAEDLEVRGKELGTDFGRKLNPTELEQARSLAQDKEPTTTFLHGLASVGLMDADDGGDFTRQVGFYGDGDLSAFSRNKLDLFICASDDARALAARQVGGWMEPLDDVLDDGLDHSLDSD